MPGLDMTKLNLIAAEWDPTPFLRASEQALAMQQLPTTQPDLAGQAPGQPPVGAASGGDWASLMGGGAPGGGQGDLSGALMQGALQPQKQTVPQAPAVAPRNSPAMQFPGMPQVGKIPTLKDLLGGM